MNPVVRLFALLFCAALSLFTASAQTPLVNYNDTWRWHKGNTTLQSNWKTVADSGLDGTWFASAGGFGYSADNANETNQCRTILSDMRNTYSTVYMRKQFQIVSAVDTNEHLLLTMDFDDGFIAWLDGAYLTSMNSPGAPGEPAANALATALHESSRGNANGNPQPPSFYDLGPIGARLGVGTHMLAIIGLNEALNSSDLIQISDLAFGTAGCPPNTICSDTNWTVANSPYVISSALTIAAGATLTIEPGVTVQLGAGVNLTVANGGRLLAEGASNAPIHFTHTSGNWGHITINGSVGSPETRIIHADFAFNANSAGTPCIEVMAGTAYLDHLTFGNTAAPYIHVDGASFIISDCVFPSATAQFELCHGTGGVKSGGHGIFLRNFFGKPISYNDVVDFTGGNRPGQPIVQFIHNVFTGSDDDCLDLDGTDAWVEGNIFLHAHKNGATPDSSSAVSGGDDSGNTSEITVIGNIIYDCDQATDAKQGNFYTFINNTIVHQSHQGGDDTDGAVVALADTGTAEGAGIYLEGNIIYDAEKLTRNVTSAIVTFSNNILPFAWSGPGGGNTVANPLLKHIPLLSETFFTGWTQAQVMREWFSLQTNSPARGTGPNGRDKGGVIPLGASIAGEPTGTTSQTNATLIVGVNRTGNGIPTAGWPNGSGFTHYKWRLDTNAWSAERPIALPINLVGLANGPHHVEVAGKNDAGFYQDDPVFGADAVVTPSGIWIVQTLVQPQLISASLIGNTATITFTAIADQTYSVFYRDAFDLAHPWAKLFDVPIQGSTGPINVQDTTATGNTRFYRIATPAQP
jgi:hypothetical protein